VSRGTRRLVASSALVVGVVAAVAAFLVFGGLTGVLYGSGILLLSVFIWARIRAGSTTAEPAGPQSPAAQDGRRWRRKSRIIAELQVELTAAQTRLAERQQAFAALDARLERETADALARQASLEDRIRELEAACDEAHRLLEDELMRFEQSLDELTGGIGDRDSELAALARDLEGMLAG